MHRAHTFPGFFMAEITYVVITSITIVTKLRIILFVITFNTLMVDMFRSLITFYVCLMFTNITICVRVVLAITSSLDQKDTNFTVYFPLLTSHVPWYEGPGKQFSNL